MAADLKDGLVGSCSMSSIFDQCRLAPEATKQLRSWRTIRLRGRHFYAARGPFGQIGRAECIEIVLAAIACAGDPRLLGRYETTNLIQAIAGREFPVATLSINLVGSFLMGFLFTVSSHAVAVPTTLRTGVLTGFVGGYTTFSTFEMEPYLLVEQGEHRRAALYVVLS